MASAKSTVNISMLHKLELHPNLIEGNNFIKDNDQDSVNVTLCVTLRIDNQAFFIYWTEPNKNTLIGILDISQIRDVRVVSSESPISVGSSCGLTVPSKTNQNATAVSKLPSYNTLTIVHGTDFVNLSYLNFLSTDFKIVQLWSVELWKIKKNSLTSNMSSLKALEKIHTHIKLNINADGKIPVKFILKMFAATKDARKVVEKALVASELPSNKSDLLSPHSFTFETFLQFYIHLVQRKDVLDIFSKICQENNSQRLLTREAFMNFINRQRDPRLNEILFPYCNEKKAHDLIKQYESNEYNVQNDTLGFEGFLRYLLSQDNQIVSHDYFTLCHNMDQPLSHYFVQSSHNTYLTGHQWTGKSSVEMYRQVLLCGCRCIELDLWDGRTKDEEPVVVHGYTLVPEILAKDVILAIAECAFKTTDFPLILSFENHCKPRQQAKVAKYCRDIFGSMLLSEPLEDYPLEKDVLLPPPSLLLRRIIIKNKKTHFRPSSTPKMAVVPSSTNQGEEELSSPGVQIDESGESFSEEEDDMDDISPVDETSQIDVSKMSEEVKTYERGIAGKESKASEEISLLVNYLTAVRFAGFEAAERRRRSHEMSSFDETTSIALLKAHPLEFVKYNKRQMSRIFPRGTRVDSSNFMPQVFWNAGCQFVALNYQTLDLPMQLNLGIFEYNGCCGYLKKPDFMCREDKTFDPFADSHVDGIVPGIVSIKVISGQFLTDRHCGTYVEVDMYGLPCDTVRRKFRTKIFPQNGINPSYAYLHDASDSFVFKPVVQPDLAVVRLAAYEESGRLIGHRVLPVSGLRPGYRHISLRNEAGQFLYLPTVFVLVHVQDYIPERFSELADALTNPIRYQSELERRTDQLSVLTFDTNNTPTLDNIDSDTVSNRTISRSGTPLSLTGCVASERSFKLKSMSIDSVGCSNKNGIANIELEVDDVSVFLTDKVVLEKKRELEKKLALVRKKYTKEIEKLDSAHAHRVKIMQQHGNPSGLGDLRKSNFLHKTLVKILSEKSLDIQPSTSSGNPSGAKYEKCVRAYEEKRNSLLKDAQKAEAQLNEKYNATVWCMAAKQMKSSQLAQLKQLQAVHIKEAAGAMKKVEKLAQEEIIQHTKETQHDKDTVLRLKREKRSFIVKRGLEERRRLNEQYNVRISELERHHENVRKRFSYAKKKLTIPDGESGSRLGSTIFDDVTSIDIGGTKCLETP